MVVQPVARDRPADGWLVVVQLVAGCCLAGGRQSFSWWLVVTRVAAAGRPASAYYLVMGGPIFSDGEDAHGPRATGCPRSL